MWNTVKLSSVCKTTSGGTPKKGTPEYYNEGTIPWIKSGDLKDGNITSVPDFITDIAIKESSAKIIPEDTLMIAMYGATVGKVGISKIEAATNQAVCSIFPNEKIIKEFLFYYLISIRTSLINQSIGGAQPNISQTIIKNLDVPLPPINQQKRIVDILKRAEGIVRLRKEQLEKTRALIPALFIDMFGDPATNPKGWAEVPINDLVKETAQGSPNKFGLKNFQYIDIASVNGEYGTIETLKTISANEAPSRARKKVSSQDVIISTVRPNLKASAIVNQSLDGTIASTGFCVLSPSKNLCTEFLYTLVRSAWFVGELVKQAKGASYPAVSDKIIKEMTVPIPPMSLQTEFQAQFLNIFATIDSQNAGLKKQETLFESLLHGAFNGEL